VLLRPVPREVPRRPFPTAATNLPLAVAAALTAILAARTFWYLFHSVTNVPYPDQWVMLDEIWAARGGHRGWSYLWSPYWGQRPLFPRLLILFSVRYLHYTMLPFVVANVAAQLSTLSAMVWSVRRLFPGRGPLFWLSAVAAVHLLLSSLQMEVFVEGIEIVYTVGYGAALAAIVVLGAAIDPRFKFRTRFWIAVLLGVLSTGFVAIGLAVWPLLMLEAWLARAPRKYLVFLGALTALLVLAYAIGYNRIPEMGMGVGGVVRHPLQAFCVIAFVLGGPISLYSPWLGVMAGAIGMAMALGAAILSVRTRSRQPAASALVLVVFFLLGSAVSIAAGRITPGALAGHTGQPVSRYMSPVFMFWAALFPVSLFCWNYGRIARLTALAVAATILVLTFGTWNWQWMLPRAWASVSQSYDAIASGFLVDVRDRESMSRIIPDQEYLARMVDYMRQQDLSVFAEARAHWPGRNIDSIAPIAQGANCRATIDPVSLGGNPPAFRVTGTLTLDGRSPRGVLDILITDDAGMVQGLARTLPAESESLAAVKFFGYARGASPRNLRLFALVRNRPMACLGQ